MEGNKEGSLICCSFTVFVRATSYHLEEIREVVFFLTSVKPSSLASSDFCVLLSNLELLLRCQVEPVEEVVSLFLRQDCLSSVAAEVVEEVPKAV